MTDDDFRKLCNTYGFAPSRALREMLDAVTKQEREACATVCENGHFLHDEAADARFGKACAAAIRARGKQNDL